MDDRYKQAFGLLTYVKIIPPYAVHSASRSVWPGHNPRGAGVHEGLRRSAGPPVAALPRPAANTTPHLGG